MLMEVDNEIDDIFMYARLAALIDDDLEDMDVNDDDEEAFRYQRPRSCWVRPWLLRRYKERPPTLYGLIQEIQAVSIYKKYKCINTNKIKLMTYLSYTIFNVCTL